MVGEFTKNTFFSLTQKTLSVFFKVLATIIIARQLGPENQGLFTLALFLPSLLLIFLTGGISFATIFYLGKRKYSIKEAMTGNFFFFLIFSFFAIFLSFFVIFFWGEKLFPGAAKNFFYLALLLIPPSCFLDYFSGILLGLKRIRENALLSFLVDFLNFLFVFILIFLLPFKIKAAILSQFLSLFFAVFYLFYLLRKELKGFSLKLQINYLKDTFLYGLKSHLSAIFTLLHYRIDHFLINIFLNPLSVGFYSIATRAAEGFWFFSYALVNVFFPTIVSQSDDFKKKFTPLVFRQSIFLFFFLFSFLFLFSPFLVNLLFSKDYLPSVLSLRILLFGTFFISLWRILSQDIFARGLPMVNVKISLFSLISNIVFNLIFIPRFGLEGAAWASSLSYSLMFFFTLIFYLRISKNKLKDIFLPNKNDFYFYQRLFSFLKEKIFFKN
ncbi:MAG: polysaccharide biosynthesis C-terminal domain-containing protein [Minisyncoccales bacterium]